jgi:hypothetical protein
MSDYDDGSEQSSRAGNAAKGAAKTGAKKAGKSLGRKLILIPLVIGLCLLVIAAAAAAITGQQAAAQPPGISCGVAVPAGQVSGTAAGFTAEQNANAKGIISGGDRNTFERGHQAALSFVDVDQVGDDSYERLSAHCEAVLKFRAHPS